MLVLINLSLSCSYWRLCFFYGSCIVPKWRHMHWWRWNLLLCLCRKFCGRKLWNR